MNQSELLSRNIAKSLACRNSIGCSEKRGSDTYIAQAYYVIEDKKHDRHHCPGVIVDTTGTITLKEKHLAKTFIVSGIEIEDNVYIQNFITDDLKPCDAGFYVYVKNNSVHDINILMNGDPLSGTSLESVLYRVSGQNTPLCILYWTGSDLVLY